MNEKIDARLSPSLHPGTFDALLRDIPAEHRDSLRPDIDRASGLATEVYRRLGQLLDLRERLAADQTRTPAAAALELDRAVASSQKALLPRIDQLVADLDAEAAKIEGALTAPLAEKGAAVIATEIRAHLRGLSAAKRQALLTAAIAAGDETTVSAALAAPAYLSGLDDAMRAALTAEWHRKRQPALAVRLELTANLIRRMSDFGGLALGAMIGIPGKNPAEVGAIRAKADAASAAIRAVTAPAA